MPTDKDMMSEKTFDELVCDLEPLKRIEGLEEVTETYLQGEYQKLLAGNEAQALFAQFLERLSSDSTGKPKPWTAEENSFLASARAILIGLASFDAFLQANVTGPPFSSRSLLFGADTTLEDVKKHRQECLQNLAVDGLSVYQLIPHVELFTFARAIFTEYFPRVVAGQTLDSRWMRIRINAYHQRLLSSGVSNTRLSDSVATLQTQAGVDMFALELEIMAKDSSYSTESKVQYFLEKSQIYIMQGVDAKARDNLKHAKEVSQFQYALSGALGKRTKFQENDISQLVVFAKSKEEQKSETKGSEDTVTLSKDGASGSTETGAETTGPTALELNDDTLLESIEFTKVDKDLKTDLPEELASLEPSNQPQLKPVDQIMLLTEATLKDVSAPLDKLNSEEILPFAVRVLEDKPTNWQVYTQALLVRSRIEAHRSRTQERSVLQLQAIVDQVIAETEEEPTSGGDGVPEIQITQFLPKAKPSESAPVTERLKFIHQLNSPTRWEIETELAYAWSHAGSLVSALEIFKRLGLWPEVALCYHSIGQEDNARRVICRQLYHSTKGPEMDKYGVDDDEVRTDKWEGEMRSPHPPHAPRLWCIIGDLEQDPSCWERAWEISNHHYPRAQRTLGEYYTRKGDLPKAREAYIKATIVNRQYGDTWSRLGDIDLATANWDGAIIAFQQAIMIDDDNSKTYSNLGSALLSKHTEMMKIKQLEAANQIQEDAEELNDDDEVGVHKPQMSPLDPKDILRQSLIAYKRGASLQYDNWQIWDNVITVAGRMSPPSFPEVLQGLRAVIRIRSPKEGEQAIDIDILRALVGEVLTRERDTNPATMENGIYNPPRGSLARAVIEMMDSDVVPLITAQGELWALVEKLKFYRRDFAGALACAEKRWRVATAGEMWLENREAWKQVSEATDGLVSAFENYGPQEKADGSGEVEKGWKMKARSAARGIMSKARAIWEDTEEFDMLKERLEELKNK
ncbi:hypothetical protein VC83_06767 [Pseudogymnoascus destructans]|uniref:Uncharacterized protein n=2 Tax=Pseudogymnoascus destructans TaxID=655981 RepID=L8G2I4_PSED2|nr:uncharacterized protein VC83_06767 [Pseudogymnoascus destructans]ELR07014.1 hypothetical protein GMDG_02336 [Pseudogymnoascus destructans 20631-21]OAF56368.1 hypothetical protein VC83_06767 [Pseudogymnoascus destructans]